MSLYHKDIGLPARYRHPNATVKVEWTKHAINAAQSDRYGNVDVVDTIDLSRFETVEVEVTEGKIVKILVRGEFDDYLDVTYALIPIAGQAWKVKTTWLNMWDDHHRLTNNKGRYSTP